jgi:ABC-type phosphate/phosphonate transport system substrate-binding protein
MKVIRVLSLCLATALTTLSAHPSRAAAPAPAPGPPRTFAVVPFYTPERMWQLYTPLIEYLRRQTGEGWEMKLFPSHDAIVKAVCAGEVDVALLGPVPLGRVNRACGALPFLVPLGKDGKPVYHAMVLTGDPGVTAIAQLRGRKFGLMKGSTAAHVLPVHMLAAAGIGPADVEPVFFESQDRIVTALLAREIAGGGIKEALYRRFEKEPLRLLGTSEPLPNFAFTAPAAQPAAVRERFVAALLKLHPGAGKDDAETVRGWDDEVKNGFMLPAPDFLPAVLRIDEIARAVLHENR